MEIEFSKTYKQRPGHCVTEVFKFDGKWYYADIAPVHYIGNECMIFEAENEDGDVKDWGELYCNRRVEITRECLMDCILEFVKELIGEGRNED